MSRLARLLPVLAVPVLFAVPAGAAIWLLANVEIGGSSLAEHAITAMSGFGFLLGLSGVILLAYIIAIPANEIVIPTVLMLTVLATGVSGVGEGAGVMILERESHARARGAKPYAAIAGYSTNCDAHSMMQLDETGRSITALIREALRVADLEPTAVDHVSAHGTSTIVNDRTEAKALRSLFGTHVDDVSVTADRLTISVRPKGDFRYTVQFIGEGGSVLAETVDDPAVYRLRTDERYVRARVVDSSGAVAWVQPVFTTPIGSTPDAS